MTFGEISQAVQEMCSGKSPGWTGLLLNFSNPFGIYLDRTYTKFFLNASIKELFFEFSKGNLNINPKKGGPWVPKELVSCITDMC